MALSSKASLQPCSSFSSAQKQTSYFARSNLIVVNSNITPRNWSIAHNHTWVSNSLKHTGSSTTNLEDFDTKHEQNLNLFKQILRTERENPLQGLGMVDAVQRLGIDYHFQEEIESILAKQYLYMISSRTNGVSGTDLHEVALRFRLLRQQGYYVPAEVFDTFKNKEGRFNQELSSDIRGLMSLYEASQLSVTGEALLDQAGEYSYHFLRSNMANLEYNQARLVATTLEHPHHKSLAGFSAKNLFNDIVNQSNSGWINVLQKIAKTEFKMVQSQHRHEILEIDRWWKDIGLSEELKFARNQPLKWHMWSMSSLTDPSLSKQRIEITKPISMVYVLDDIFDVYGTLDELELFTEIVNRWDDTAAEELPFYIRICFDALHNITNELSYKIYKEHGWNPEDSLRKSWASLCNAFLVEAKWFASGKLPTADDYLKNGIVSSGVHVVLVHIFFLLGQDISKETVELINSNPGIISSTATILRLWDDLGSAKDENQDGKDGSYVECYIKEHKGLPLEGARNRVHHLISEAWKQLNRECLSPNPFSTTFSKASLNIARMVPLMYNYNDNHCLPKLEEHVKLLLHENVSP